jgi:hypothetical protein
MGTAVQADPREPADPEKIKFDFCLRDALGNIAMGMNTMVLVNI